ncbi:polymer-forming cytoskeletal protein [uncultured Helicobacter sp.]|uniref:bactofilin family protein n=1 Tax=uncultured Helicobacter sp. TaxID=175537 RepID=UPI00262D0D6A|nr:polymer-forming cytoskeletal protein [uncultured Helicobacter sp.]
MYSECSLHIDGDLEGNIVAKTNVVIGKTGNIDGSIDAEHLVVSGKLMGNCTCSIVEILPQGRIDGSIVAKELIIEKGGEFVGQSVVHKNNEYKTNQADLKAPKSISLNQKTEEGVASK